jgi:flagellar hook assembly protein FlgD
MTDYQAKGVGFLRHKGKSHKTPVTNEDNGKRAGHHVEHWDGRKDAVATPSTVQLKVKAQLED